MVNLLILFFRIYFKSKRYLISLMTKSEYFNFLRDNQNPTQPITFDYWFDQYVLGKNSGAYWPVHRSSRIVSAENILIGTGSFPGYMPGCYIQGIGTIIIGEHSIFGPNVGLISANHNILDQSQHIKKKVIIGDNCWVGMNSVILPGVELGNFTIVGAGSVVKNSFKEGYCVIAGNPAKVLKLLDSSECKMPQFRSSYRGYISKHQFPDFARAKLSPELLRYIF